MWAEINQSTIVTLAQQNKYSHALLGGRAFAAPCDVAVTVGNRVDLADAAARVRALRDQVAANFIGREELTEAMTAALVSGEHLFVLGPPGTAKSAVIGQLTKGLGGNYWRILLNPDISREDLVGPLDPTALKQGKWRRRWAGLASADVAFLDECWKASDQVSNMMLDALEERRVVAGDDDHQIPLLSAIGASNEVPESKEAQAAYDRWMLRLTVGYLRDPQDFRDMLTVDGNTAQISQQVTADEIRLLAAAAEYLALSPPDDVMDAIAELWREMGQDGRVVSDRRWRKTLKIAVAYALLNGETPAPHHLGVGRWTLWADPDEEKDVRDLVLGLTDPIAGEVLDVEALLADMKNAAASLNDLDLTGRAEVAAKCQKLSTKTGELLQQAGAASYNGRLTHVQSEAQAIVNQVLSSMA
jgi:MoxR-like ATPase